ncbi:hypothetical protein [Sulfidibacter corallicola]|uniref:DUF4440 domain-containing protein n=1 Tax=Sulfidibacter corallicola TaxID=2818388 RepID=A0A8A4TII2_SULCO|nr:hypothetical protein [Sulfidibacter corallicola]QTD49849.1 hypothetical protein J3U87_30065 [Sulfidibacter corallicola]
MSMVSMWLLSTLVHEPVWHPVAEAERAFAQTSRESTIVEAFKKWVADDSILFRPTPVNGADFFREKKPSKATLWWQPTHVVISADRSMGLSTGPYVFRDEAGGQGYYGHFLSVWGKQADGSWRVLIDDGVSHDDMPEANWPEKLVEGRALQETRKSEKGWQILAERDRHYAGLVERSGGWKQAFEKVASQNVRLYRRGTRPIQGRDAAVAKGAFEAGGTWEPMGGKLDGSGSLGFTYGTGRYANSEKEFLYLRVWQLEKGEYRLLAELVRGLKR